MDLKDELEDLRDPWELQFSGLKVNGVCTEDEFGIKRVINAKLDQCKVTWDSGIIGGLKKQHQVRGPTHPWLCRLS
eukprot:3074643-Pyramimonas_sp.AAC.1